MILVLCPDEEPGATVNIMIQEPRVIHLDEEPVALSISSYQEVGTLFFLSQNPNVYLLGENGANFHLDFMFKLWGKVGKFRTEIKFSFTYSWGLDPPPRSGYRCPGTYISVSRSWCPTSSL